MMPYFAHFLPPAKFEYLTYPDISYSRNYYTKAAEDYTKAIELDPDNNDWYLERARMNSYMIRSNGDDEECGGCYEKSISDYTYLISLYPDDASLYKSRARVHENWGDNKKASQDYDKAMNVDKFKQNRNPK